MSTLPIGSIAPNLTSDHKVLLVALPLLAGLDAKLADKHQSKRIVKIALDTADLNAFDRHALKREVGALIKDLNRFSPAFCYVGHAPNDESHLGVWVDLAALHAAEQRGKVTQVSGTDWRGVKSFYVLSLTDGGLTLYRRKDRAVIWSV